MAQKKITDLQLIAAVTDGLSIPGDNGIQTYRATGLQFKNYILAAGNVVRATLGIGAIARQVVTAVTTTYPITTSDDVILCSGSAFTVTLPTAASVSGRCYLIKKTDSSLTNIITIATTSAQTIDGASTTTLNTENESVLLMSDGSNWLIIDRRIPGGWVAYTPVMTAFPTASNVAVVSKRERGDLLIKGRLTLAAGGSGSEGRMTLGFNGTSANVTSAGAPRVSALEYAGHAVLDVSAAGQYCPLIEQSKTYFTWGIQSIGGGGLSKTLGSSIAGGTISWSMRVPIDGWND